VYRPRLIPILLVRERALYKTIRFAKPTYVGDPINTVKLFNDKEVDELVVLDIGATMSMIDHDFVRELAEECFMPLCYGGGVKSVSDVNRLIGIGAEKVAINTAFHSSPALVSDAVRDVGTQSVVVAIDVRKGWRNYEVMTHGGTRGTKTDPITAAKRAEDAGAGEILLTAIDREGTMKGYDFELLKAVSGAVRIPVVANGGAGTLADFRMAVTDSGASAAGAGSFFVFQGPHRAVLVTFPREDELVELFK
jgi:cyclase